MFTSKKVPSWSDRTERIRKIHFFNVISGVYRPDSGSSVLFDNHEISQLPPHKITELGISRTFQLLRLFLEMTVLENVMVGYHCHTPYGFLSPILQGSKVREADEKIQDEMIEMLQFLGSPVMPTSLQGNSPEASAGFFHWGEPSR